MSLLQCTIDSITPPDGAIREQARNRQNELTKPKGSLGQLEELSVTLAGIRRTIRPELTRKAVITFAGDHHTVHEEGIASAPMDVTVQMMANFIAGGAGVNAIARSVGARVAVADMGVALPYPDLPGIYRKSAGKGAANITKGPAMTREHAVKALEGGMEVLFAEADKGLDIVGIGEMGIGNTTPASAIMSLLSDTPPEEITGPGAGITDELIRKKVGVIKRALEINRPDKTDGLDILSKIGGFEIGGMAGAMIAAASRDIPVLVDGFISTAAALLAISIAPACEPFLIPSHFSAETGYAHAMAFMKRKPLLDLGMRLGEGSGAAMAMALCDGACSIINNMSTFAEASVAVAEMRDTMSDSLEQGKG
ncbi:MAG: nicotinate-nucleotide--dimethylbenzimidazole phosphoribosyltransferase [Spirochaetales bacterium]|nr:nicotinate-nucleotide--dimethylbenzimidazole phosphoribosyltransferase [Spirochaetales bacterium]